MKKIISMCLIIPVFFSVLCFFNVSKAVTAPVYDSTYNNNAGAFYANGVPITINTDSSNNTVVYWDGGRQIVPNTVTIFGGGTTGSSYESSNITMENGTVSYIYGGGVSLNENEISYVKDATIVINNGTILGSLMGGGLIYTNVENSNITINNGTIAAVNGGGGAFVTISGVNYSAGSEDDLINSKNRTNNTNIVINNGTINSTTLNYGLVYAGGQGYSYTGNANLVINGGDMSKAYVTAAGSNGYTENGSITVNNGTINILQTTNRGIVGSAKVKINGGNITNAYVGGETDDPTVTGVVNQVEFDVLGGNVTTLDSGISGAQPIEIEQNDFKLVIVEDTITNNNTGSSAISINYEFKIIPNEILLNVGETEKIQTQIKTTPPGYENLFNEENIMWSSSDNSIAYVDENGYVTGKLDGTAMITAKFIQQEDSVEINVANVTNLLIWILAIVAIGLFILCLVLFFSFI